MGALSNIEAEAALLGAILSESSLLDRVADIVSPEDFSEPLHQRIFATTYSLAAQGKRVTPVTLKPYFENDDGLKSVGGLAYLARLSSMDEGLLAPFDIAQQVRDLSRRRSMQAGLQAACDACGDLEATMAEIVEYADGAIADPTASTINQPTGGEAFDSLIRSFGEPVNGVQGGIEALDGLLGPMRPKQLVIGAGRPGMGKTAFALSYALGVALAGHGVLFVSLEMSAPELAARMAADMCFDGQEGVPFNAIRDGNPNDWQLKRLHAAASQMQAIPFQIIDAGSLTTGRLNMLVRRHARRMQARGHELKLVVVDYLQLLSTDGRQRSNYETVSEVSRSLKALAKDNNVAVLALAQLSREVEKRPDKRPQLSDLRDSGQIEQDADAVMFLLRPEYYLRQAEPDPMSPERGQWQLDLEACQGAIEFIVAKRRNGVTGSTFGRFHGAYQAVR